MRQGLALGLFAIAAAAARADDLFVSSLLSDEVLRFNGTTGTFIDAFVSAGSGGLDGPQGIARGPDGNLYVAAEYSGAIHRYDGATGAPLGTLASGLTAPNDITFGPDGLLYFLSHGSDRVRRYDITTSTELPPIMLSDGTHHSHGMTFGPDGLLYIGLVDGLPGPPTTIRRLNPATLTDLGTFVTLPSMASLFGLAFLPDGSLVADDTFTDAIYRFNGVSGLPMPPLAPPGSITDPFGMRIGPDGLLYVCSGGLGVQRYDPVTGVSLGGFISGGMAPGRSPFAPAWGVVPAPGTGLLLLMGVALRRRRGR
jgi:streptogramin lyase